MANEVAVKQTQSIDMSKIEQVLIKGDLAGLNDGQRISYYRAVCETVGLNPLTKPFEFINLNGKTVLYALKACTDQLRQIYKVSIKITNRTTIEGVYVVTAGAQDASGRVDESTGAVQIAGLKGDALANAFMKAETKAKRRVTLSICGLGMLDETEVDSIPNQPPRIFPEQPGDGDGVRPLTRSTVIPNGANARKKVSELSFAELCKERERLEGKDSPTNEELQTLEQVCNLIETMNQIEPGSDIETKEKPRCSCGLGLTYSRNKGVYYCPNFKAPGEHIRPMSKEEYENA